MGTFLEDYLESIYHVPSEIKRNFQLMRELDEDSHHMLETIREKQKKILIKARNNVKLYLEKNNNATEEELKKIIENDPEMIELNHQREIAVQKSDEKIAIATQTYQTVDNHICILDEKLNEFKSHLKNIGEYDQLSFQTVPSMPIQLKKKKIPSQQTNIVPLHKKTSGSIGSINIQNIAQETSISNRKRSIADSSFENKMTMKSTTTGLISEVTPPNLLEITTEKLNPDIDIPIDPHEPIYCTCRRVSYGQMIGCDNDECNYEWFHFECVGLKEQPTGQWYCKDCKTLLGMT